MEVASESTGTLDTTTTTTTDEEDGYIEFCPPSDVNHSSRHPSRRSVEEYGEGEDLRRGTIFSARLNLLSTMVGGGSLSLPLAFNQAGNGFLGPLLLILMAIITEFCLNCIAFACERGDGFANLVSAAATGGAEENDGRMEERLGRIRIRGKSSYESISGSTFGLKARYFTMVLVFIICFFAVTAYAVLLRDLLEPVADAILPPPSLSDDTGGPTLARNAAMLFVVLLVTPLCTLRSLTPLQNVGVASMISILILAAVVAYRSLGCNMGPSSSSLFDDNVGTHQHHQHQRIDDNWTNYVSYFPSSISHFLSSLPVFVSCYICHYNVPLVHNELSQPSPKRIRYVLRTTIWSATAFYLFLGFIGSMYGNCTPNGIVQGNVLLSFDEDDPLLLIGRACLAMTITLAFPMIVIPARDTALNPLWAQPCFASSINFCAAKCVQFHQWWKIFDIRSLLGRRHAKCGRCNPCPNYFASFLENCEIDSATANMSEPLLVLDKRDHRHLQDDNTHHFTDESPSSSIHVYEPNTDNDDNNIRNNNIGNNSNDDDDTNHEMATTTTTTIADSSDEDAAVAAIAAILARIVVAIVIFWLAAAVACTVQSIDVVWDLLGSSISIAIGFLIPSGAYLILSSSQTTSHGKNERVVAWIVVGIFIPLMFVCTGNAIYTTFIA